jgi:predicted RNA-binding protein
MNTIKAKSWLVAGASILSAAAFNAAADPTVASAAPAKEYTGTVMNVDRQENTLETRGFLFGKKFNLGSACIYSLLEDTNGTEAGLHAGQKVTVTYQNVDGVLVADRIEQQPMRLEGRVKSIDQAKHTVTVHEDGLGLDKQFLFAAGCKVMLRDDKAGAVSDIQPGNYVALVYETPTGLPTVQIISQTSQHFTGTVTALDLDERTVKARSLFDEKKFNLGENCVIVANGRLDGQLSDLKPEDNLIFTYDEIEGVNVVNHIAPVKEGKNSVAVTQPASGY